MLAGKCQIIVYLFFHKRPTLNFLICTEMLNITMKLLTVSTLLCAMVALGTAAGEYSSILSIIYTSYA